MYQHLLLIYSDYSEGKRIAFYRCYDSIEKMMEFIDITDKIKETFNHLTFSFHNIQTKDKDICSIESYDPYFRGIEYYTDLEEYIELVRMDTVIDPLDIAKIILSKKSFCQLSLEKIMYFADCEYIKKYGKPIFTEEFEAWSYGPVIPRVYQKYKSYKYEKIRLTEKEKLMICSKMMKFEEYDKISKTLDEIINRYDGYDGNELVTESHKEGAPWDKVYQNGFGRNQKISKDLIREYIEEGLCF